MTIFLLTYEFSESFNLEQPPGSLRAQGAVQVRHEGDGPVDLKTLDERAWQQFLEDHHGVARAQTDQHLTKLEVLDTGWHGQGQPVFCLSYHDPRSCRELNWSSRDLLVEASSASRAAEVLLKLGLLDIDQPQAVLLPVLEAPPGAYALDSCPERLVFARAPEDAAARLVTELLRRFSHDLVVTARRDRQDAADVLVTLSERGGRHLLELVVRLVKQPWEQELPAPDTEDQ